MRKSFTLGLSAASILIVLLFPLCNVPGSPGKQANKITLTWNKSFEGQTQNDIKRGMIWTLSWLGAELPRGSFERACEWSDTTRFTINLDSLGFNEKACKALRVICDSIKRSEQYKRDDAIDIGQFSMLTLGSSWHYYEITGVPETLEEFRQKYDVTDACFVFGVTASSISEGHRRILFSCDTSLFHYGFLSEEGTGSLTRSQFTPVVYECFDIMPNGQLRFMIYNAEGELIDGTPQSTGDAGKPGKCLWCHETTIQTLFIPNESVPGMLTSEEFLVIRDSMQVRLERYRLTLNTDMNWKFVSDHTQAELLYITFMEPTVMHMMNEWKMSEPQVRDILKYESHETFKEFTYIGEVYQRSAIDAMDTTAVLTVPKSARETLGEVNYFK